MSRTQVKLSTKYTGTLTNGIDWTKIDQEGVVITFKNKNRLQPVGWLQLIVHGNAIVSINDEDSLHLVEDNKPYILDDIEIKSIKVKSHLGESCALRWVAKY